MPGMMDTVLNLGLNDDVVVGLATKGGQRFAYDSYRRFLDMFGDVVSIYIIILCDYRLINIFIFTNYYYYFKKNYITITSYLYFSS